MSSYICYGKAVDSHFSSLGGPVWRLFLRCYVIPNAVTQRAHPQKCTMHHGHTGQVGEVNRCDTFGYMPQWHPFCFLWQICSDSLSCLGCSVRLSLNFQLCNQGKVTTLRYMSTHSTCAANNTCDSPQSACYLSLGASLCLSLSLVFLVIGPLFCSVSGIWMGCSFPSLVSCTPENLLLFKYPHISHWDMLGYTVYPIFLPIVLSPMCYKWVSCKSYIVILHIASPDL